MSSQSEQEARRRFLENGQPTGQPLELFPLLTIADLAGLPEPSWLVDGLLQARAFNVLYGASGVGKSFVAKSLALCIASGTRWLGARDVTPGPVLYIAAEGAGGLKRRVDAWCAKNEAGPPDAIHFLPDAVNLLDQAAVDRAQATIDTMPAPPVLIIVDTLARCYIGGAENSTQDMGQFVHNLDQLRGPDTAALVVHHTGKRGEEERGSSALRGAADTMLALSPGDGAAGLTLECTKLKDGEPEPPLSLRLVKVADSAAVELGNDLASVGTQETTILEHLTTAFGDDRASRTRLKDALTPTQMSERSLDRHLARLANLGYVSKRGEGRARYFTITDQGRERLSPQSPNSRHGDSRHSPPPFRGGEGGDNGGEQ